jgi:hypothetical protein
VKLHAPDRPKLLLVDYENVQQVELARLDEGFRVIIFVGVSQKSVPIELVTSAQKLDFFIALHLGRVIERSPRPDVVILSKDKGFDPLLKYLNANGLKARRVSSLSELQAGTAAPVQDPNLKRVVELLGKSDKRSRPRKRRTLAQAISAMHQKKLSRPDIDRIINSLFALKLISEAHGIITYEF